MQAKGARGLPPGRGRGRDHVRASRGPGDGGRAADRPELLHLRGGLRGGDRRRDDPADRRHDRRRGRHALRADRGPRDPRAAVRHFEGRLEYHAPWHTGRQHSHLFRGEVDVEEANRVLAQEGHDDLRLLDNGAISTSMAGLEVAHAYHLVPKMVSKANAVAAHMRARQYEPQQCIAVGDSIEDLEVAGVVGRFFVVANGPRRDPGLREAILGLRERDRHRGKHGRRLLRGGRLDPGRTALGARRRPEAANRRSSIGGRPVEQGGIGCRPITPPSPKRSTCRSCTG